MRSLILVLLAFFISACSLAVPPISPKQTLPSQPRSTIGKLLFEFRGGGYIYIINSDGSSLKRLTDSGSDRSPAWSPDGQQIVFECGGICVMNADGSSRTNFTHGGMRRPNWSPDGQQIAFATQDNTQSNNLRSAIFSINADGSGLKQISSKYYSTSSPLWSPDGKHIVFLSSESVDSPQEIKIVEIGWFGNRETTVNLSENAGGSMACSGSNDCPGDESPAWSPSGNQIAFVETRDSNSNICLAGLDGIKQKCLTDIARYHGSPAWSPDGSQIAFISDRSGKTQVYVMNADGSRIVQLTDNLVDTMHPVWSQDGRQIAFVSSKGLFVMDADGKNLKRVMEIDECCLSTPKWQP